MTMDRTTQISEIYDLYRLVQGAVPSKQHEAVHQQILEHVVQGFEGKSGTLALADESFIFLNESANLIIVASINIPAQVIGHQVLSGQGILGWVAKHGEDLLLNGDLCEDARFRDLARGMSAKPASAICWALKSKGRLIGVLSINRTEELPPYTNDDLEKGAIAIGLISMMIDNIRLHRESQQRIAKLSDMNNELVLASQQLEKTRTHLMQSEKMASIGQLAAGVAHEINNPIGYVYSNLGALERYVQDAFMMIEQYEQAEGAIADEAVRAQLKAAREKLDIVFLKEDLRALMNESRDGITRVKKIVQNLQDFSHVDASDEWYFADLHKGLDSTLNIVNNEIKYKANVIREYGDIPEVECLLSQLNQVFMNLLVNAAQAIEGRGTITIRTGSQGDEVWVEIADTGTSIAPENIKKIFDPFFTTKPIGKGTGLGLSLSYGIIQKHHGRIEVQSEPGKGTTFSMWLPIRQPQDEQTAAERGGIRLKKAVETPHDDVEGVLLSESIIDQIQGFEQVNGHPLTIHVHAKE